MTCQIICFGCPNQTLFKPKQQKCWPFVKMLCLGDGNENKAFVTLLAWRKGKK
jgi:hypothetical protein